MLKDEPASDGSAYEEYVMTATGARGSGILAMRQWSEEFAFAHGELPTSCVDRQYRRRVRKLETA